MRAAGMLSLVDQLALVEHELRTCLPDAMRALYLSREASRLGLLPLATGHERAPNCALKEPAAVFAKAQRRYDSVLGHLLMNDSAREHGDVWPTGLLVVEDCGCAIYHAVDLADPRLRVIECEHLDPVEDPEEAADGAPLAYGEPSVPRSLQHRFTVAAASLDEWLQLKSHAPPW